MCLIIDINIAREVLFPEGAEIFEPIRKGLKNGKVRIVGGGQLSKEYAKDGSVLRLFSELLRSGRARLVDHDEVYRITKEVKNQGKCRSNDAHIIALAKVGGVRLMCTKDQDLRRDFVDADILSPRGNLFSRKSHHHLLREHCAGIATP